MAAGTLQEQQQLAETLERYFQDSRAPFAIEPSLACSRRLEAHHSKLGAACKQGSPLPMSLHQVRLETRKTKR
eukprot:4050828-Amphidinium_carterae.1